MIPKVESVEEKTYQMRPSPVDGTVLHRDISPDVLIRTFT